MSNCPICRCNATTQQPAGFDGEKVNCPRCGEYRINGSAIAILSTILENDYRKIANASGWIRDHQNSLINPDTVQLLLDLPTPSLAEKSLRLLKHLENRTSFLGNMLRYDDSFLATAWAMNDDELKYVFDYLKASAYITFDERGISRNLYDICLTPSGFSYLEQTRNSNTDSHIGFCAMWFDDSMKAIWRDAINPAILAAGYEPKRIDEHPHNNRIDDEIIALIRRSRFVVADFTGQRGGVYFEAGFALGMNLPVIWTVKKSALPEVHFDNRQYNFVTWEEDNLAEFRLNLQYRIEATPALGRGTWRPGI